MPMHVDRSSLIDRSMDRSRGGGAHVDPRSMKNHGKSIQKSSQNRPQIHRVIDGSMDRSIDGSIPQIVEKSSKIAPKSTQNRRKSHPNRPQIGPKSPKIRPWDPMGTPGASQGTLGAKKVEKVSSRTPPGGPFGDTWATLGATGPTFSPFLGVMWVVGATIAVLMSKTSTRGRPNVPKPQ